MLKTKKTRLYIEDQIVPYSARKVRMVMDFITDENILKFPLEKGEIEDLTIFGVNRDWESGLGNTLSGGRKVPDHKFGGFESVDRGQR